MVNICKLSQSSLPKKKPKTLTGLNQKVRGTVCGYPVSRSAATNSPRRTGGAYATHEARASDAYKQAIVDGNSDDIVYSNLFTGVHGNYLKPSVRAAGLDPDNLPVSDPSAMSFGGDAKKAWKDIWGCGQGIGAVTAVTSVASMVERLTREYTAAQALIGTGAR